MRSPYRQDKAAEVASLLLKREGGKINYTKLIKLMYIIERESILRWGYPVTCDDYYSLDNGPILSHTLDNITGNTYLKYPSPEWENCIVRQGYDVVLKCDTPVRKLNRAEVKLVNEIYDRYGHMTYGQLIEWVHNKNNVPEWQDPEGSRLPIKLKTILRQGNYPEEDIDIILEELQHSQAVREVFAA